MRHHTKQPHWRLLPSTAWAAAAVVCSLLTFAKLTSAVPTPILAPGPALGPSAAGPNAPLAPIPAQPSPPGPPSPPPVANGSCFGKAASCGGILTPRACSFQPGCHVQGAIGGDVDGTSYRCSPATPTTVINCTQTIGYDFCLQVSGCEWHFAGVQYGPGFAKPPMAPPAAKELNSAAKICLSIVGVGLVGGTSAVLMWYFCNSRWYKKDQGGVNTRAVEMSKEGAFVTDWDLK